MSALHRKRVYITGTLLVLGSAVGIVAMRMSLSPAPRAALEAYAAAILEQCRGQKHPRSCYDEEIPKLMDVISMEEAFGVARIILAKDPPYGYCHVLGHKLSGRETRKDLTKWRDVLSRCPTDICNYGCLHGPLLERFAREHFSDDELEAIKPELAEVCVPRNNWTPTLLERSMCYHGMGHLHMYLTSADVGRSIELCRYLGERDDPNYFPICLEGVFMQIFQPLEPEDEALVKDIAPSRETLASFCGQFDGIVHDWCWREAWPLFREELQKPEGVIAFCSNPRTHQGRSSCRTVAISIMTTTLVIEENSPENLKMFCTAFPSQLRDECFEIAVMRIMQVDTSNIAKALEVCALAEGTAREGCYKNLAGLGTQLFHASSEEFLRYCDALPPPWDIQCRTNRGT